MKTLTLPLKAIYFNQIKSGKKTIEYRLCTPFWKKRIEDRKYDIVALSLGYPKRGDNERWLYCRWQGYTVETIQHEHFGLDPVRVYAINVFGAA
jgi:hypothetical protein